MILNQPVTDMEMVTSLDELVRAFSISVPYRPEPGGFLVGHVPDLSPTATLTAESMEEIAADPKPISALAETLQVFAGHNVVIMCVEDSPHAELFPMACMATGVGISVGFSTSMRVIDALFEHLPSREEFIANDGEAILARHYNRARRIINGEEPYPGSES